MKLETLTRRIVDRAVTAGVQLADDDALALARHVQLVLEVNPELHLTSIRDPAEYLERHLGEAFEGAAQLPADIAGAAMDLGSGNGYPGLPLVAARRGLRLTMSEASPKRAAFLRRVTRESPFPWADVLESQVQRAVELADLAPFRLIVTRAMGGWEKIVPRLVASLTDDGTMMLWAGEEVGGVLERAMWRRLRLVEQVPLPGRERSWIWRFARAEAAR